MDSSVGDDLEPYFRLIELQKQMIDLVEQNGQAQRECAALRAKLAREADELYRAHSSVGYRLRKSASSLFRRLWWREYSGRPARTVRADLIYRLDVREVTGQARRT